MDVGRHLDPALLETLSPRFPEIELPTLLIWGRHDHVVPLHVGTRLASALPNAELVILERCGHLPPEERPEAGFVAVRSFLDRTDADCASAPEEALRGPSCLALTQPARLP